MKSKDRFKRMFDFTYEIVKRKMSDIQFPCYGGQFYRYLLNTYNEYLHLYLTPRGIAFTASVGHISEVPYCSIKSLSVRQSRLSKSMYHIRLVADKKYHFYIYDREIISTELTGNVSENVKGFIDTLQSEVQNRFIIDNMRSVATDRLSHLDICIDGLPAPQVTVLRTGQGNTYVTENDIDGAICARLKEKNDTHIVKSLTVWKGGQIDLPSYQFRKALLAMNAQNRDTELILQGKDKIISKKLSQVQRI